MPVLDLFFVLAKLLFYFSDGRVNRTHEVIRLIVGHEIVLVFGGDLEVDAWFGLVGEIHNHVDGSQPIVNPREFFDLRGDLFLRRVAELTMPGGNFDLHQLTPLPCAKLRPAWVPQGLAAVNGPF
jgi:hypothetical protein